MFLGVNVLLRAGIMSCFLVFGGGCHAQPSDRAELVYLEALEDVPLAPGLQEDKAEQVVFDKPDGRIVESQASGASSWVDVRAFYERNLPQLGWVMENSSGRDIVFEREGEQLEISVIDEVQEAATHSRSVRLHFSLAPN